MSIPAVIFWILALASLFTRPVVSMMLFFATVAFGALAVVPPDALGGANILPQSVAGAIMTGKMLSERRRWGVAWSAARDVRGYGLECGFVAFALLAAALFPLIFADQVSVISMRGALNHATPLEPTISNFAQSAYLLVNLFSGLALFSYVAEDDTGDRREQVLNGLLVGGAVLAASGLLDISTSFFPDLKDFILSFKTASYTIIDEATVFQVRRITGFFTEAAAFADPAVGLGALLYFIRPAFRSDLTRNIICPAISVLLIALAALSTSSTGYLGLATFAVLAIGRVIYRLVQTGTIRGLGLEVALVAIFAIVFVGVVFFDPEATRAPIAILNEMVFQKTKSLSYNQRTHWNNVAMQAFFDTFGVGVGAGSARTSDWLISLLSNTGVVGFALMMGFILAAFLLKPSDKSPRWAQLMTGSKLGFVVFMATEVASGTTIDPGFLLATNMALIIGSSSRVAQYLPQKRPRRRSTSVRSGERRRPERESPTAV
jgi:hypothetical protein